MVVVNIILFIFRQKLSLDHCITTSIQSLQQLKSVTLKPSGRSAARLRYSVKHSTLF